MANGLYLIKNPEIKNDAWGSYRAMVVSAASEEAARLMRPINLEYPEEETEETEWPGPPERLVVTYLGESKVPVGVILCDNVGW